jgi:hypothetical protein
VDFGLAKIMDDESGQLQDAHLKTQEGVLGTPAFMSPEQARGEISTVGPHSDQYSLGAVLYQCLTGHPPFKGSVYVLVASVAGIEEPTSIRELAPAIPRDLASICEKSMSKEISARYKNLESLSGDLSRWLRGETVEARPVTVFTRLARWTQRNPVIATLGGILAVVLFSSILILQAALSAANRQKSKAEQSASIAMKREEDARREAERARRAESIAESERDKAKIAEAVAQAERDKTLSETNRATAAESKAVQLKGEATNALVRESYLLALSRWEADHDEGAGNLLEKVPESHRNFEWHLARRQVRACDFACYGHTQAIVRLCP